MQLNNLSISNIDTTEQFRLFDKSFAINISFLDSFSDLIFLNGRIISFISDKKLHQINSRLLDSAVKTLQSIRLCCSIGSFSDANTLNRKLRDDLLLFVYILDIAKQRKPFIESDIERLDLKDGKDLESSILNMRFNPLLNNDEKAVEAWLANTVLNLPKKLRLQKLSFENYMNTFRKNPTIDNILVTYRLEDYWQTLTTKLNNYVHNNGSQFTSHNLITSRDPQLEIYLNNVNTRASYIISLFLILITMVDSTLLSSTDMIDYLDMDMEPPENCQYEIAAFIKDYLDTKVVVLHPELKRYLHDNNSYGMRIL